MADDFWSKVDLRPEGCWLWKGSTDAYGYGQFCRRFSGKRIHKAHRVAWEKSKGPIPDGQQVLHRCDNPSCVNPEHLFLGTQLENIADMVGKLRNPKGEKHGSAKLSDDQIDAIRLLGASMPQRKIAERFGVTQGHVSDILNGRKRK